MHANLHMSTISRSNGREAVGAAAYRSGTAVTYRSVVAAAAYRSGEKVNDERYEKTHDYTKKHNVEQAEIITPEGAPEWMNDREKLWNAVEAGEKRKDAQLAKEALLVLPRNLTPDQQKEVVRSFIRENIISRGLVADYAIHSPEASDGEKNPHAHVMFTLRPIEGEGFGKKLTGFHKDQKAKDGLGIDGKNTLQQMRQSYEHILNRVSEQTDSEIRFDLRSLKDRGIDREPQPKIGPKVTHLEKRGYRTEWGKEVRQVIHENKGKAAQVAHYQFNRITYLAARAVDNVRDDVAHIYYEVMYGPEAAYGENYKEHDNDGYQR